MIKLIDNFLKEIMQGNRNRVAIRIPPELEDLLKEKALSAGYKSDEFPIFLRETLASAVLPEILKSELVEVNSAWFLNEGSSALELNIGKSSAKLEKIKQLASHGLDSYTKFFDDLLQAEVKLKNEMNDKISKELN